MRYRTVTIASDLVADTDLVVGVNYAGACTITLPTAATSSYIDNGTTITNGKYFIILDASGNAKKNNITINSINSDTILGTSSIIIDREYGSLTLFSDGGTAWYLL